MARGGCATQHVRAHLARLPARQRNPADEAATRSGHKQPGPSPLGHPPSTAHPEGLPWGGGGRTTDRRARSRLTLSQPTEWSLPPSGQTLPFYTPLPRRGERGWTTCQGQTARKQRGYASSLGL